MASSLLNFPDHAPSLVVTQEDLITLELLKLQYKRAFEAYIQKREEIRRLVEHGAALEQGPHRVHLFSQMRFE